MYRYGYLSCSLNTFTVANLIWVFLNAGKITPVHVKIRFQACWLNIWGWRRTLATYCWWANGLTIFDCTYKIKLKSAPDGFKSLFCVNECQLMVLDVLPPSGARRDYVCIRLLGVSWYHAAFPPSWLLSVKIGVGFGLKTHQKVK